MNVANSLNRLPHQSFSYPGVVDADAHVLEPPWLWTEYMEHEHKHRALRIARDRSGLEVLLIDNRPARHMAPGYLATLGMMGETNEANHRPDPEQTYLGNMPFGAMDADERVALLDHEGIERCVLYPTLALVWEAEIRDVKLAQAYCRAYNRWIAEFCRPAKERLIPVAHISLGEPEEAAKELERAIRDGCRGAFVVPFTFTRKALGDPVHDRVFAIAQEANVPLAIHPADEPHAMRSRRFDGSKGGFHEVVYFANIGDGIRQTFTSMFAFAAFQRFPKLKFVILESGAGWIGYHLDRLDSLYFDTAVGQSDRDTRSPTETFRQQCSISCDPFETRVPPIVESVGAENFLWASDYPHADHPADYVAGIECIVEQLPESVRAQVLGANATRVYGLS